MKKHRDPPDRDGPTAKPSFLNLEPLQTEIPERSIEPALSHSSDADFWEADPAKRASENPCNWVWLPIRVCGTNRIPERFGNWISADFR